MLVLAGLLLSATLVAPAQGSFRAVVFCDPPHERPDGTMVQECPGVSVKDESGTPSDCYPLAAPVYHCNSWTPQGWQFGAGLDNPETGLCSSDKFDRCVSVLVEKWGDGPYCQSLYIVMSLGPEDLREKSERACALIQPQK